MEYHNFIDLLSISTSQTNISYIRYIVRSAPQRETDKHHTGHEVSQYGPPPPLGGHTGPLFRPVQ